MTASRALPLPCLRLLLCLAAGAAPVAAQNYENSRELEAIVAAPAPLLANITRPPLGLPPMTLPARNPPTQAKIDLGRKLFFDRRLSFNRTLSCAMCHTPEQGFTQYELKTPVGFPSRSLNLLKRQGQAQTPYRSSSDRGFSISEFKYPKIITT